MKSFFNPKTKSTLESTRKLLSEAPLVEEPVEKPNVISISPNTDHINTLQQLSQLVNLLNTQFNLENFIRAEFDPKKPDVVAIYLRLDLESENYEKISLPPASFLLAHGGNVERRWCSHVSFNNPVIILNASQLPEIINGALLLEPIARKGSILMLDRC